MYRKRIKPVVDFLAALVALIVLSPVFLLLIILISLSDKGSPFFLQERPGKGGNVFKVIKFRTMNDRRDPSGKLLPDAERITPPGRFIRRSSLDEIPQLINVIKGDMSLVGPRPLLTEYLPLYTARQARRHEVRPGITGLAQVNGRNTVSWEERLEMDVWYVENVSVRLDARILYLTAGKVLRREGVSAAGQATMQRFTGSHKENV